MPDTTTRRYPSETAIRDAQRYFRGRSQRRPKARGRWVLEIICPNKHPSSAMQGELILPPDVSVED